MRVAPLLLLMRVYYFFQQSTEKRVSQVRTGRVNFVYFRLQLKTSEENKTGTDTQTDKMQRHNNNNNLFVHILKIKANIATLLFVPRFSFTFTCISNIRYTNLLDSASLVLLADVSDMQCAEFFVFHGVLLQWGTFFFSIFPLF